MIKQTKEHEAQFKHKDIGRLVTVLENNSRVDSMRNLKDEVFEVVRVITRFDYSGQDPIPTGYLYVLNTETEYLFNQNEIKLLN